MWQHEHLLVSFLFRFSIIFRKGEEKWAPRRKLGVGKMCTWCGDEHHRIPKGVYVERGKGKMEEGDLRWTHLARLSSHKLRIEKVEGGKRGRGRRREGEGRGGRRRKSPDIREFQKKGWEEEEKEGSEMWYHEHTITLLDSRAQNKKKQNKEKTVYNISYNYF